MFTRVTVVGSVSRATLLLPPDEPIVDLVPDIARLLQEPPSPSGLTLVGRLGEEIDVSASSDELDLADGTGLRLVARDEAPPPPEVSDVTEVVSAVHDRQPGRWETHHRLAAGAVVLGLLAALFVSRLPESSTVWVPLAYILLTAAAWPGGRYVGAWAGITASALAVGLVPVTTVLVAERLGADAATTVLTFLAGFASPDGQDVLGSLVTPPPVDASAAWTLTVFAAVGLTWLPLGLGGSGTTRRAAPAVGAATGTLLSGAVIIMLVFGLPVDRTMAVLAVLVVLGIGLVPLLALEVSRLATLDDLVIAGRPADRQAVERQVAAAYATFSWTVAALATAGSLAAARLLVEGGVWPTLVGVLLVLVFALRTRVVPLAVQALAMWAGALVPLLVACLQAGWPGWVVLVTTLGLLLATITTMWFRPRPHTRVRLRRVGDMVELVVVLALVPCILGLFGAYVMALGVF